MDTTNRETTRLDYKKAIQSLNLFASENGGVINRMKALKLLYFAEWYHLRKYGRLITNDTYYAMKKGAVPSKTMDIIEDSPYVDERPKKYAVKYLANTGRYDLSSVKPVDDNVFSDSDMEALKFAWERFGHLDHYKLAKMTHDYPEWIKHKHVEIDNTSEVMDLMDFFDDPIKNRELCFPLSNYDRNLKRDYFNEMSQLIALWK